MRWLRGTQIRADTCRKLSSYFCTYGWARQYPLPAVRCSKLVKSTLPPAELEARKESVLILARKASLDEAGSANGVPDVWVKQPEQRSGICGSKIISSILRRMLRNGLCQERGALQVGAREKLYLVWISLGVDPEPSLFSPPTVVLGVMPKRRNVGVVCLGNRNHVDTIKGTSSLLSLPRSRCRNSFLA